MSKVLEIVIDVVVIILSIFFGMVSNGKITIFIFGVVFGIWTCNIVIDCIELYYKKKLDKEEE